MIEVSKALESVSDLAGRQRQPRQEGRYSIVPRPEVHVRVRIPLKEVDVAFNSSQGDRRLPVAIIKIGALPAALRFCADLPIGPAEEECRGQFLGPAWQNLDRQAVAPYHLQGQHVGSSQQMLCYIEPKNKGAQARGGILLEVPY